MANIYGTNVNLLIALDALLQEGSVSRAAIRVGLSQPAMSNQLSQLRSLLDDPLLVRVGNRMVATPRAESLRSQLRAGVAALESVLAPPVFEPARCDVAFRVALNDITEMTLLPSVLARLGAAAPRASLQVTSGGYFRIPDALATGELDAVAGYYDSSKLGPDHHECDLFRIQLTCLARQGHPLVNKGRITKRRYLRASHVVVTETWGARGIVDEVMPHEPNEGARHIGARVPRLSLVPPLVAQTDLLCAIEGIAAETFLAHLPLQRVSVPFRLPGGTVGMVWHERTHHDPARAFLRQLFREAAAELENTTDCRR